MSTIIYDQSTRPEGSELPAANFPPEAGSNQYGSLPTCMATATSAERVEWYCTRAKGHGGNHVGHCDEEGGYWVGLAWRDDA